MLRDIAADSTVEQPGAEVEQAGVIGAGAVAPEASAAALASEHAVVAVVGLVT